MMEKNLDVKVMTDTISKARRIGADKECAITIYEMTNNSGVQTRAPLFTLWCKKINNKWSISTRKMVEQTE